MNIVVVAFIFDLTKNICIQSAFPVAASNAYKVSSLLARIKCEWEAQNIPTYVHLKYFLSN